MFFVGHIAVAFTIAYLISAEFHSIRRTVSISMVMFLSTLPDIDMVFRLIGIDLGHRTFTHSLIISLAVGMLLILLLGRSRRVPLAVYLIAYLSHILIGDVIVANTNIAYPIGYLIVDSGINSWSLSHLIVEIIVLGIMTPIVVTEYYIFKKEGRKSETLVGHDNGCSIFLFSYHPKMDGLFYPITVLAIVASFVYISVEFILSFSGESLLTILLVGVMHLIAIILIILIWITSKRSNSRGLSIFQDKNTII